MKRKNQTNKFQRNIFDFMKNKKEKILEFHGRNLKSKDKILSVVRMLIVE